MVDSGMVRCSQRPRLPLRQDVAARSTSEAPRPIHPFTGTVRARRAPPAPPLGSARGRCSPCVCARANKQMAACARAQTNRWRPLAGAPMTSELCPVCRSSPPSAEVSGPSRLRAPGPGAARGARPLAGPRAAEPGGALAVWGGGGGRARGKRISRRERQASLDPQRGRRRRRRCAAGRPTWRPGPAPMAKLEGLRSRCR